MPATQIRSAQVLDGTLLNADVNAAAAIALTKLAAQTADRALVSDGSGFIVPSAVTATELGHVSGVTSAIQTQLDAKLDNTNFIVREVPSGLINDVNTTFTLAATPVAGKEHVYLNGLLQNVGAGNDYTISGDTITFNTAPATGDILLVSYVS